MELSNWSADWWRVSTGSGRKILPWLCDNPFSQTLTAPFKYVLRKKCLFPDPCRVSNQREYGGELKCSFWKEATYLIKCRLMPCKECGHATHPSQHTAPWILRFIKIHFNTTCWQIFPQGVHITNRHCSSNAFQTAAFPSSCPPPSRPNAKQRRIQEVRRLHAILFCLMFDVVGRFVAPPTNQPTQSR